MGREVRRVPADWKHPTDGFYPDGKIRYQPLLEGYTDRVEEWDRDAAAWARGEFPEYVSEEGRKMPYEEYDGPRPKPENYMPEWPEHEKTHYMMYETTSEGTPKSPAFATPEELAQWLAYTGASIFADYCAGYDEWLEIAKGKPNIGLVIGVRG